MRSNPAHTDGQTWSGGLFRSDGTGRLSIVSFTLHGKRAIGRRPGRRVGEHRIAASQSPRVPSAGQDLVGQQTRWLAAVAAHAGRDVSAIAKSINEQPLPGLRKPPGNDVVWAQSRNSAWCRVAVNRETRAVGDGCCT